MSETVDVVVVGAGFAGLVAARELGERGLNAVVLEGRDRVGGRTYYRRFGDTDQSVELGGTWFDPNHHTSLRDEAARYGIPIARGTEYQQARWYTGGKLRTGLPFDLLDGGDLERIIVEAHIAGRMLRSASPDVLREYDNLSLAAWLDRHNPKPATRDFIYGFITLLTGADPERVPALGPLMSSDELGNYYRCFAEWNHLIPTGTLSVAEAIARDVQGDIRLNTAVRAISQTSDGVVIEHEGGRVNATYCVVAVPVNAITGIAYNPPLPVGRTRYADQGHLCRMTKLWILATGVPEAMIGVGWNTPFYWVAGERQVGGAQLVLAWAIEGAVDPSDRVGVKQALQVYAPDASVLGIEYHDWVEDRFARGAWMVPPMGWATDGARALLGSPHGRIRFAGSDVAPQHSGSIEGAIRSGRAVAEEVSGMIGNPSAG